MSYGKSLKVFFK